MTRISAARGLPAADTMFHSETGAVAVAELNNDGHPDIVVYRGGGNLGRRQETRTPPGRR